MNPMFRLALLFVLSTSPLLASQQGIVVREAKVYAEASSGASQVGVIAAGRQVDIFSRKGGWKEIYSDKPELLGWVISYQVREGDYAPQAEDDAEPDSRGFLSGLAAFSGKASRFFGGGSSATSSGTATIGVRGLSEEELKAAKPDLIEFARMQGFASDARRLASFAQEGRLSVNEVAHIEPATNRKNNGSPGKRSTDK
jgi:hypothetical protein